MAGKSVKGLENSAMPELTTALISRFGITPRVIGMKSTGAHTASVEYSLSCNHASPQTFHAFEIPKVLLGNTAHLNFAFQKSMLLTAPQHAVQCCGRATGYDGSDGMTQRRLKRPRVDDEVADVPDEEMAG